MTPAAAKALLEGLPGRLAAHVDAALDGVADAVAAEARRLLSESTGRPSRPGEPPADSTGALGAAVVCTRMGEGGVMVEVSAPSAVALEFGTRHIAARPFLRPAVANTAAAQRAMLSDAVSRAVRPSTDGNQ